MMHLSGDVENIEILLDKEGRTAKLIGFGCKKTSRTTFANILLRELIEQDFSERQNVLYRSRAEVIRFVQSVVGIVMYGMLVVVIVRAYFGIDIRNLSVRVERAEKYRFCEKVEAFGRLRNSAAVKHQLDFKLLVLSCRP